ncbi:magnesium transporter [Streptomyces sp. TRM66268-LWL]|uniref:Magnesium transporter n=2 Tax=Streptomyces polyasparticus TaxID=2767826 RepID=A0ABR7SJR0_9ACTN|nr:magnesium transporter [Streptomyces polyasparticus]
MHGVHFGLTIGISIFVTTVVATALGFLLPWLLAKSGMVHAPAADPLITTIKDFTGVVIYFALAGLLMGL